MKAKDYRKIGADKAKPISGRLALILFLYFLISVALGSITGFVAFIQDKTIGGAITTIGGLASIFIEPIFVLIFVTIYRMAYQNSEPGVPVLFSGFKTNYWKTIGLTLLISLYLVLWGFWSLGIGSLIKGYSYSMSFHVLEEHPEMGVNECITKSKEMMHGHKWNLFCLEFSYIGWCILCAITCGILALWVVPKMNIAYYAFYNDVKGAPKKVEVVQEKK